MARWEYRIIDPLTPQEAEEELNRHGEEGFELVAIHQGPGLYILRRSRPPEAKDPIPQPKPGLRS